MADGTDEDGARAAGMDEWVVWEAEERIASGANLTTFSFIFLYFV